MPLLQAPTSTWNQKTVVFVHGIGKQPEHYSKPLFDILFQNDPMTVSATRWHEVAYDMVNTTMQSKVIQFQGAIEHNASKPSIAPILGDFLIDLVDYLCLVDPYNWINNVFKKELVDVVAAGLESGVHQSDHQIYLVTHSLGTVVSYEALHSIIDDAQSIGLPSGFKIKTYFTLGSPLAFIKHNQDKIPSMNEKFFLRKKPISKPTRVNGFSGNIETNILEWINLGHTLDPVASLVPLTHQSSENALSEETRWFKKFHSGANPHAFDNYMKEFYPLILEKLRG